MDKPRPAPAGGRPLLEIENLGVAYGGARVLSDVSFSLFPGQWLMVAGPNGAGKTTLLNAVSGAAACTGRVLYRGEDLPAMPPGRRARCVGMLAQSHRPLYAFTVEEVVRLGRYAWAPHYFGGPARTDAHGGDSEKVDEAIAETGLAALRRRSVLTLSGGELQRVFLAQLLAQDPGILLLDEPANHLDPAYQRQIFTLVGRWISRTGRAALCVVHDLNLALAYGSHALLMDAGRAVACGAVNGALTPENLQATYHMDIYAWMRQMLRRWEGEDLPT